MSARKLATLISGNFQGGFDVEHQGVLDSIFAVDVENNRSAIVGRYALCVAKTCPDAGQRPNFRARGSARGPARCPEEQREFVPPVDLDPRV